MNLCINRILCIDCYAIVCKSSGEWFGGFLDSYGITTDTKVEISAIKLWFKVLVGRGL
jgi:hypothetical protein